MNVIEPGTIFCPYCCRTHKTPFYTRGDQAIGVELRYKKDTYDITEKEWVDPAKPEQGLRTPDTRKGLQLHSTEKTQYAGLPTWVDVLFPESAKPIRMRRTCPHCARENDKLNLGTLPTLIVGMVGTRASGKSAMLNSIALPQHQAAVNDEGYPYLIDISPLPNYQGRAAATPRMGRGMTKLVAIKHRKSNTPIAHVLLLDVSGELLENRPMTDSGTSDAVPKIDYVSVDELTNILAGTAGYPGVSAVIFADPITTGNTPDPDFLDFNPATIMSACLTLSPNFAQIPMAYVRTHLDRYYEEKKFPTDSECGYPLMTANTFWNPGYDPVTLVDRIFTEDSIARRLPNFVPAARSKQITKGFLLQSCSCRQVGKDKIETYTDSKNVMDPLLWILNKLRVFPLTLD